MNSNPDIFRGERTMPLANWESGGQKITASGKDEKIRRGVAWR